MNNWGRTVGRFIYLYEPFPDILFLLNDPDMIWTDWRW